MDACFPARLFAACMLFTSNEKTRYYLQGVHIDPLAEGSGVTLAATNGNSLGAGYARDGFVSAEVILAMTDKPFLAACKRDDSAWICIPDGELATATPELFVLTCPERPSDQVLRDAMKTRPDPKAQHFGALKARARGERVEASYPLWRRVVPRFGAVRDRPSYVPWMQAAFLKQMADAATILTEEDSPRLRFCACDDDQPDGPVLVDFPTNPVAAATVQFLGIVMPYREKDTGQPAKPDWLGIPTVSEAQAALQREMDDADTKQKETA